MSRYIVKPTTHLAGPIRVPGDKSVSHRSLMLGGIAEGVTEIRGFLLSEDCLATLRAMRALGVTVEQSADVVRVHGVGLHGLRPASHPLDMGNAGTAMRLMTGLLAGQAFDSELVGDSSLMKRPMERVAVPLRSMGAQIATEQGKPPVRIHGGQTLHGIDYALPVASAQVKSAIMLAGVYADSPTVVREPAVTRDHTERMLGGFGCVVSSTDGVVRLEPPKQLRARSLHVPADFSSAAFFIVGGCIGAQSSLLLEGVGINPTRTGLIDILRLMGASIRLFNERSAGGEPVADIEIVPALLRGIQVPEALVPLAIDEFPVLFVAAACAQGETVVTGAEELRVKESDRIAVMAEGLRALGCSVEVLPDGIRIQGRNERSVFGGGTIDSHGDHRIAMSFAIASLRARDTIEILDTANVATSFPGFITTAQNAGLVLEETTAVAGHPARGVAT